MKLDKITLVAVSSVKIDKTIKALKQSMDGIEYGEVLLISHEQPVDLPVEIKFKKCHKINSIDAYNWFMIFELGKYVKTDFVLVIQYDGYVLNPNKWIDGFMNYDYIGAPWSPQTFFDKTGQEVRVGNGGFSLRSKKLLNSLLNINIKLSTDLTSFDSEDNVICVQYRSALEAVGIKFAPVDIAAKFSRETADAEFNKDTFGFHCSPIWLESNSSKIKKKIRQKFNTLLKGILGRKIINKLKNRYKEHIRLSNDVES